MKAERIESRTGQGRTKVSIRFFNDREVRAVWDDARNGWFFSVLDVVGALNGQDDYQKNRNYWKWLKAKLKREGNQLVGATTQLKLRASDGKRRASDVLDAGGVVELVRAFPNNKAAPFLDWFLHSGNSIDGRSKYVEMNVAHPFMEGNGRATRIWLDLMLNRSLRRCIDWSRVDKTAYLDAMRRSVADPAPLKALLAPALTAEIGNRETFMKGIDYSYYYEQPDDTPPPC